MKKIEMHCHILPGIDDGAQDMKQSLEMLDMALDCEIVGAIVTPHGSARDASHERVTQIRRLCRAFREQAERKMQAGHRVTAEHKMQTRFPVFPGQEILYSSDVKRLLDEGKLLTLADTRYVLLEFIPSVPYSILYGAVREMRMGGYVPVLAHVERYPVLREGERLAELAESGAKIQMNYSSVGGSMRSQTTRWCRRQLMEQNVHMLSTDMHDTEQRRPDTRSAEKWMHKHLNTEYVRMLVQGSARAMLEDRRKRSSDLISNKRDKGTRD